MTKIPGINAKHAIITDECRANRGDLGAFGEASHRLMVEFIELMNQRSDEKGVNYHLVLVVEDTKRKEPEPDKVRETEPSGPERDEGQLNVLSDRLRQQQDVREYLIRENVDRNSAIRRVMLRWGFREDHATELVDSVFAEEKHHADEEYRCAGEIK